MVSAFLMISMINTLPFQGRSRSDGGYMGIYTPPPKKKSVQVNFLWGKNDVRTAIQHFYTPNKKLLYPQNKFLATPLFHFRFFSYPTGQNFSRLLDTVRAIILGDSGGLNSKI